MPGGQITPGVQPYWAAWELAEPEVDHFGQKWRFMSWIGEQWRDWRRAFGLPENAKFPEPGQPPFHHWLMDRFNVPEPWRSGRFDDLKHEVEA